MSDLKTMVKHELGSVVDRAELANAIAKLRKSMEFFDAAMYNYDQAVIDELESIWKADTSGFDHLLRVNALLCRVNNFIPTPQLAFEDDEDGITTATDMFQCSAENLSEALNHLYAACPTVGTSIAIFKLAATYPTFLACKGWYVAVEKTTVQGLAIYGSLLETLIEYQSETKG